MRILLLGCNGQVGWELQRSLAPLGELIALDRRGADLSTPQAVAAIVRRLSPSIIVNAAAYTAVDKAESEPDLADLLNACAVGVLAREAQDLGAWLVHYSTDYVFDGKGTSPWAEDSPTAPLSVYGRTKLAGERLVQQHCSRHLVFRTSWVYSVQGSNFAKTILRLAAERAELTVVDDQIGAPTGADLIADITSLAIREVLRPEAQGLAGIYHLTASGETSWHGYARHVVDSALRNAIPLKTVADRVKPVPSSAFNTAAPRPANSRMDTRKLRTVFGVNLPDWRCGVDRMLAETLEYTQ